MHTLISLLPHPLVADFSSFDFARLMALAIPIVAILIGGAIAICAMYIKQNQRRMWHETARLALEKGQPMPAQPYEELARELSGGIQNRMEQDTNRHDFRAGLILIGIGAGLYFFFAAFGPEQPIRFVGAIPGFIGVALLLHGVLSMFFSRNKSPNQDRPPQP